MTKPPDPRFESKKKNLKKALQALEKAVSQPVLEPRDLSGIIKDFEIVFELSWKVLKMFLENEGHETTSAKDAFSKAFQLGYIKDQNVWLEMINDRNMTVHTYDERLAEEMGGRIREKYSPALQILFTLFAKKS